MLDISASLDGDAIKCYPSLTAQLVCELLVVLKDGVTAHPYDLSSQNPGQDIHHP